MFFWLNSDKNDVVVGAQDARFDTSVIGNGLRGVRRTRRLRARLLCVTAAVMLSLLAESLLAAPPLFDTSVRIGTPFFARVRFPTPVRANLGLIRLPNEAEVADVGGTWRPLNGSLELVPSVSKPGVYYLNSRIPVDRDKFDIYLAQEGMDSLDIFAFDVRLVDGATRVSVQTLKWQQGLTVRPVTDNPTARADTYSQSAPDTSLYTTTPGSQAYAESFSDAKPVQAKAKARDVELDDDLSEKLRELIAAQAVSYQKPIVNAVEPKGDNASGDTEKANAETNNVGASNEQKASANLESTSMGAGQSVAGQESPATSATPMLEREMPSTAASDGIFNWQLSMAELLFIAFVGWMVYFGKVVLGLQKRVLSGAGFKGDATGDGGSTATGNASSGERIQASAEAIRSPSSGSALADVLRTAAEQAERSERLGAQSRWDASVAGLASAQQLALFECATRLQGLTTATEFSGTGDVAGQMPVQAPIQTPRHIPSQGQPQTTATNLQQGTRPEKQAGATAGDAQARPNAPAQSQAPLSPSAAESQRSSGPQSNPSDQRKMGPAGAAKFTTPTTPNRPVRRQGSPSPAPVPPKTAPDKKQPAPSQDYGEQISLAVVYFTMGEVETARELLETVIKDGSADEKAEARKFMQENFDG